LIETNINTIGNKESFQLKYFNTIVTSAIYYFGLSFSLKFKIKFRRVLNAVLKIGQQYLIRLKESQSQKIRHRGKTYVIINYAARSAQCSQTII